MKKVLVFAEKILPPGQTFIPVVVNALTSYQAQYVGLTPVKPSAVLPSPPVLLTTGNTRAARVHKELYRITGIAPNFHQRAKQAGGSLIHAHFAEGAAAAVSLSRVLNLPLLLHLRGGAELYSEAALRRKLFEWSYLLWRQRLWERASLFLCVSEFIRRKAQAAGFPAEKLRVHYTGIDFSRFTPDSVPPVRDRNLVLYVGRLVRYKGADQLVRAMAMLRESCPAARLVLIGEGWFRPAVEALARELRVDCNCLGDQPPAVVREYMQKARVFCAPSVTLEDGMSEAFGNVFTEAQAMGVPVVAYRHGGIVETMLHGETGLLADEFDMEELSKNLRAFLCNDDLWERCSRRGAQWVRETFDVRTQTAALECLYDRIVASGPAGADDR